MDKTMLVAFASYCGGTGRTTAMLKAAEIMAKNGKTVVVVDLCMTNPQFESLPLTKNTAMQSCGLSDLVKKMLASEEVVWDVLREEFYSLLKPMSLKDTKGKMLILPAQGKADFQAVVNAGQFNWLSLYGKDENNRGFRLWKKIKSWLCSDLPDHLGGQPPDCIFLDVEAGYSMFARIGIVQLADMVMAFFRPPGHEIGQLWSLLQQFNKQREVGDYTKLDIGFVASMTSSWEREDWSKYDHIIQKTTGCNDDDLPLLHIPYKEQSGDGGENHYSYSLLADLIIRRGFDTFSTYEITNATTNLYYLKTHKLVFYFDRAVLILRKDSLESSRMYMKKIAARLEENKDDRSVIFNALSKEVPVEVKDLDRVISGLERSDDFEKRDQIISLDSFIQAFCVLQPGLALFSAFISELKELHQYSSNPWFWASSFAVDEGNELLAGQFLSKAVNCTEVPFDSLNSNPDEVTIPDGMSSETGNAWKIGHALLRMECPSHQA